MRHPFVQCRGGASLRYGHDPRQAGHCRPHGTALCRAGDGPLRVTTACAGPRLPCTIRLPRPMPWPTAWRVPCACCADEKTVETTILTCHVYRARRFGRCGQIDPNPSVAPAACGAGRGSEYIHFPRFDAPVYGALIARFLRGEFGGVSMPLIPTWWRCSMPATGPRAARRSGSGSPKARPWCWIATSIRTSATSVQAARRCGP